MESKKGLIGSSDACPFARTSNQPPANDLFRNTLMRKDLFYILTDTATIFKVQIRPYLFKGWIFSKKHCYLGSSAVIMLFCFLPVFFLFLRYPLPEPEGSTDILEKAILV